MFRSSKFGGAFLELLFKGSHVSSCCINPLRELTGDLLLSDDLETFVKVLCLCNVMTNAFEGVM